MSWIYILSLLFGYLDVGDGVVLRRVEVGGIWRMENVLLFLLLLSLEGVKGREEVGMGDR